MRVICSAGTGSEAANGARTPPARSKRNSRGTLPAATSKEPADPKAIANTAEQGMRATTLAPPPSTRAMLPDARSATAIRSPETAIAVTSASARGLQ
jgi:hypothetical protein